MKKVKQWAGLAVAMLALVGITAGIAAYAAPLRMSDLVPIANADANTKDRKARDRQVIERLGDDPACGFDVYRGQLTVTSLSAKGKVSVWLIGRGGYEVRKPVPIAPGQIATWTLKHRHTSKDFQVAIVKQGTKHDHERVDWCEAA